MIPKPLRIKIFNWRLSFWPRTNFKLGWKKDYWDAGSLSLGWLIITYLRQH